MRYVDVITTPWPAFMVCCSNSLPDSSVTSFKNDLCASVTHFAKNFRNEGIKFITQNTLFHYPNVPDVKDWFDGVSFNFDVSQIDKNAMLQCIDTLVQSKLIDAAEIERWEASHDGGLVHAICHDTVSFN